MSCTGTSDCVCGCCSGTSVQTPQPRSNLSGLTSIAYRAGTWASFKESMLARLSSSDYPVLAGLQTRDDDDFTIAFLDASAIVLDILTFYQERLANESYLRTAGRLQSLIELSRLIGYRPSPGVSASAYVAFTLKAAPGQAPDPSAPAITIPKGTQLQSVPAQGQTAQTFETSTDISAKADWNALPLQTGQPWVPADDLALPGVANRGRHERHLSQRRLDSAATRRCSAVSGRRARSLGPQPGGTAGPNLRGEVSQPNSGEVGGGRPQPGTRGHGSPAYLRLVGQRINSRQQLNSNARVFSLHQERAFCSLDYGERSSRFAKRHRFSVTTRPIQICL